MNQINIGANNANEISTKSFDTLLEVVDDVEFEVIQALVYRRYCLRDAQFSKCQGPRRSDYDFEQVSCKGPIGTRHEICLEVLKYFFWQAAKHRPFYVVLDDKPDIVCDGLWLIFSP
ncbi:hypothetical protein DL764_002322 [Monosporascus ibericus]|uniref:Uncharacterized protein n=1 Tax=Monosporascus ibericus TaxID=155417 RepID=A0A4Q4TQ75_9PEZI|nr:hypothetical protein DL764_002322 [Monosporascus ibericus]